MFVTVLWKRILTATFCNHLSPLLLSTIPITVLATNFLTVFSVPPFLPLLLKSFRYLGGGTLILVRAIHLIPTFTNRDVIDAIRKRFDPLVDLISPHITLVFPFESGLSREYIATQMARAVEGIPRFPICLASITGFTDGYLFLNVKQGNDALHMVHDRLYTGLLAGFRDARYTYVPHITVGRIPDSGAWEQAVAELSTFSEIFSTIAEQIVCEIIGDDGRSHIETVIELGE